MVVIRYDRNSKVVKYVRCGNCGYMNRPDENCQVCGFKPKGKKNAATS